MHLVLSAGILFCMPASAIAQQCCQSQLTYLQMSTITKAKERHQQTSVDSFASASANVVASYGAGPE